MVLFRRLVDVLDDLLDEGVWGGSFLRSQE